MMLDSGKAAPFFIVQNFMLEFRVEFSKLFDDDLQDDVIELVIRQGDDEDRIFFKNQCCFDEFCNWIKKEPWKRVV